VSVGFSVPVPEWIPVDDSPPLFDVARPVEASPTVLPPVDEAPVPEPSVGVDEPPVAEPSVTVEGLLPPALTVDDMPVVEGGDVSIESDEEDEVLEGDETVVSGG
jgi:hypothetical protein